MRFHGNYGLSVQLCLHSSWQWISTEIQPAARAAPAWPSFHLQPISAAEYQPFYEL